MTPGKRKKDSQLARAIVKNMRKELAPLIRTVKHREYAKKQPANTPKL